MGRRLGKFSEKTKTFARIRFELRNARFGPYFKALTKT